MIATIAAWTLPSFLLLATALPLVRNDYWTFRVLEYPRFQKLILGLAVIATLVALRPATGEAFPYLLGASVACCIYLLVKIFPYTPVAPREMVRARSGNVDGTGLKIFAANVLQTNRDFDAMLKQIQTADPDIVFLVETDEAWAAGTKALEAEYPYTLHMPLDNTYGLLFFSRLPVRGGRVLFRADPGVPSIEADVQLPAGPWVKVYGLHPKPPVPGESQYSTAKDKELMMVALEVEKHKEPIVVMGDLNDVAWSHVTTLFRKVSGLLDPRRGRGFYSTFSARNWLMRFPLDYVFCSDHFGLVQMKRMPYNGSDHFAMSIHLQYDAALEAVQEAPKADAAEREEAAEKASAPVPAE
jgi:endonuclease/exonuclease/phosphatase (EEP) superfamily protein YafD